MGDEAAGGALEGSSSSLPQAFFGSWILMEVLVGQHCGASDVQRFGRHQAGPHCLNCFQQTMSFYSASISTFPTNSMCRSGGNLVGVWPWLGSSRSSFYFPFTSAGLGVFAFRSKAECCLPPMRCTHVGTSRPAQERGSCHCLPSRLAGSHACPTKSPDGTLLC